MAGRKASISMLIGGDASGLSKATKKAAKSLNKFSKDSAQAAKKVGKAFGAMTGAITVAAAGLGAKAVDLASDFDESMSKTKAIFKDGADSIVASANEAATAVGLSKGEFLDGASAFGVFGVAAGLSGDDLAKFSADLVTASADIASFSNLRPEDALDKLRAGLSGETEPLKQIGILFNAATVQAKALEMGLADVNGEISEGSKIMARNALIMESMGSMGAAGDFKRTSEGLANQQRILTARLKDVGITIGTALLPIAMKLAEALSALIAVGERWSPQLATFRDRVKELAVQWMPQLRETFDNVRAAIEPVIASIIKFVKNNPKPVIIGIATAVGAVLVGALAAAATALAGIIFSVGGLVVAISAAVGAIAHFWQESETFRHVVTRVFEDVKAVVDPIMAGIRESVFRVIDAFQGIIDFLKGIFKGDFDLALSGLVQAVFNFQRALLAPLRGVQTAFKTFFSLDAVKAGISKAVDTIYNIVKAIPGRVASLAKGAFIALLDEFKSVLTGIANEFIRIYNWIVDKINKVSPIDLPQVTPLNTFVPDRTSFGPPVPDMTMPVPRVTTPAVNTVTPLSDRSATAAHGMSQQTVNIYANDIDGAALIGELRRTNRNSGGVPIDAIGFNGVL